MMADNQLNDVGGDNIFVYTGGDQEVPRDVKRVRIAENVDTIPARTFYQCRQLLIEVGGHNKIKKIEKRAFWNCQSLRSVTKMTGLIEIEENAFRQCLVLSELDFDKLEIIGKWALAFCYFLRSVNMPSIRRVGEHGFKHCFRTTDVMFGEKLEKIEEYAFDECIALRRIVIPLKDNLIIGNHAFNHCRNLSRVDTLAGGIIHQTISSLHLESWRDNLQEEIDRINQALPITTDKTTTIQQWIDRVLQRMEHYKNEHQILLKEAMTLIELALWKARLLLNEADEKKCNVNEVTKKATIDAKAARKEHRVTCGASIVVENVLPFLALK